MRAYVVGNVAVDETIAVASMPEAGASIFGREDSRDLGGKGANQAVVMSRTGLATTFVTAVGDDFRAGMIREQLGRETIDAQIVELSGRSSDFSIIFTTPDGENAIITTTESAGALSLNDALAALEAAAPGDLAVLQGNLSEDVTLGVLSAARARGMTTAFNPSPLRPYFASLWPMIDIAFLNRGEALSLVGSADAAAISLLRDAGVSRVVLTLGSEGALLGVGDTVEQVPAIASRAVDTTGAGDTFMAMALASASLRGVLIDRQALAHAAVAAALTVSRRGTRSAFPTCEELAHILVG